MNILCKNWFSNRLYSNYRGNFMVRRTLILSAIIIASFAYSTIIYSAGQDLSDLDKATESIRSTCNPDFLRKVLNAHKKDPLNTYSRYEEDSPGSSGIWKETALVKILRAAFQCPGKEMTRVALAESDVELASGGYSGNDNNSLVNIAADSGNLDALKTVVEDYSRQSDSSSCLVSAASWWLNGYSPLSLSVLGGNLPMAQYLIKKGAKVNQCNTWGRGGTRFERKGPVCARPLRCALKKGNPEMVEFLLQKGATASEEDLHYTERKLEKCALKFGKDDSKCKDRQEIFAMFKKIQQQRWLWWGGLSSRYSLCESCCHNYQSDLHGRVHGEY